MKALILAAGLGTRLRPFTQGRAKPTLPVLGVPTLWYGAWHLKRELAVAEFMANLSHAPASVREAGDDAELRKATGIRFEYSDESDGILGSSGALWKIRSWIGHETLAVCNGDSISFPSWARMLKAHRESKALITMHARACNASNEGYTNLLFDAAPAASNAPGASRVTGFGPKARDGVMFAGSYLIEPQAVARLAAGVSELRPSLLEPLAKEGGLYAYREDGPWFDTGDSRSYAQTQFELLDALPGARELIEAKMQERAPGCWVPKTWGTGAPALKGPVVLIGNQSAWAATAPVFGPRFIGLEPPHPNAPAPHADAIVSSKHVERL